MLRAHKVFSALNDFNYDSPTDFMRSSLISSQVERNAASHKKWDIYG